MLTTNLTIYKGSEPGEKYHCNSYLYSTLLCVSISLYACKCSITQCIHRFHCEDFNSAHVILPLNIHSGKQPNVLVFQEAEDMLCSDSGKKTASDNSDNTGFLLVKGTKGLKQKTIESVISPISSNDVGSRHEGRAERLSDTSLRTCDLKDLVRKCLSEYKEWEEKHCTEKPALVKETAKSSICHLSSSDSAALVKQRKEKTVLEKPGVKRGFELVDGSPTHEFCLVKKSNAEYKRGCRIPEKQSTGLTAEICCLKLAGDGGLPETCTNRSQATGYIYSEQHKDGRSTPSLIPKNLMHDLDAGCEKDEKHEHEKPMNFSFICIDDEKPLASMSVDSDLSLPEMSVAESHIEKLHSSLDGSIKDFTFEELKTEDMSAASLSSSVLRKSDEMLVQKSKLLSNEQDKNLNGAMEAPTVACSSQTTELMKTLNVFKKNVVAFRSYNSPINMSNTSEPSRLSTVSIEGMDISACSGSYPMAITPAQKGRSYTVCQVSTYTRQIKYCISVVKHYLSVFT